MTSITYTQFKEQFKPVKNPINPVGPYEGTLFDKGNPALIAANLQIKRVWSVIQKTEILADVDSTEVVTCYLTTGVVVNPGLLGYMVTELPYIDPNTTVTGVPVI